VVLHRPRVPNERGEIDVDPGASRFGGF
jgi:hypothetical protein